MYRISNKKLTTYIASIILTLILSGIGLIISENTESVLPASSATAVVTRVVDGDTIHVEIDGEEETIRMIGVDTPESVKTNTPVQCFAKEASDKTKALLLNKTVRLENDPSQDEQDRYGRLLRYVYLEDGTLINEKLIAEGFAFEYTYEVPYKFQKEFKSAQRNASQNKLGLWADNTCSGRV